MFRIVLSLCACDSYRNDNLIDASGHFLENARDIINFFVKASRNQWNLDFLDTFILQY